MAYRGILTHADNRRAGHSATVLACCCAISMAAGALFCYQFALSSTLAPMAPAAHGMLRRSALELPRKAPSVADSDGRVAGDAEVLLPKRVSSPGDDKAGDKAAQTQQQPRQAARTYEAAVQTSGLLDQKPAVKAGDSGHSSYVVQPMQLLSLYPRAYLYPGFMDGERADHIVAMAEKRLAPSGLALRKGDTLDNQRDVRTSQGTFVSRDDDPDGVLAWVEEKTAQITGIPSGHGEAFNVLRYENGQHYDAHYDVFDPDSYGPQTSQRMVTVLFYLSNVTKGGETVFPLEGADGVARLSSPDFNYRRCDLGLTVKPRKGDALLFYSLHVNGTFDKHALHGGCPVMGEKDTKWVATKWIRDKCFSGRC